MSSFRIGSGDRDFHFDVAKSGWVSAVPRSDGTTPVIGGQFDLGQQVEVPADWSDLDESTGFNTQISRGDTFYPGAGFDESLVEGQTRDVLWALRHAQSGKTGRLLELGCGPGYLLGSLAQAMPGWSVHGLDPSPHSVRQARSRGLEVSHGTLGEAPPNGPFDAVVVMGNFQLHHDPAETLRSLADLSGPGAELYLDTKNPNSAPRQLARFLVRAPGVRRSAKVQAFAAHSWHGLRHGIPRPELVRLMQSCGWKVVEVRTVAPRLLRFGNAHNLARGINRLAWRVFDLFDAVTGQRAWIQVAALRIDEQ